MKKLITMFIIIVLFRSLAITSIIIQQKNGNSYVSNLPVLLFYSIEAILLWLIYKKYYIDNNNQNFTQKTAVWIMSIIVLLFLYLILEENITNMFFDGYVQILPFKLDFISVISISFFSCISEEIIFRGVILNKLKSKFPFMISNIIQALIFGIIHAEMPVILFAFIFGLFLGYILHRSNLIYCILIHCIGNLVASFEAMYGFDFIFSSFGVQVATVITCSILFIILLIIVEHEDMGTGTSPHNSTN